MLETKVFKITKQNLEDYIQDRTPYLFVDEAEVIAGKSAKGLRYFSKDEWFFKVHFPGNPIVPAAFLIESITQTAGLAIQIMKEELKTTTIYIKKISNVELYSAVKPDNTLFMETEIINFKRGIVDGFGTAYTMDGTKQNEHCRLEFQMVMPDILQNCSPKIKMESK